MIYTDKNEWRAAAFKKYKVLTMRITTANIMLYFNGKLAATFNRITNRGVIFNV